MSLNLPTDASYKSKLNAVKDLMSKILPQASKSVGSALYELVLRPVSAIYASIDEYISNYIKQHTLREYVSSDNIGQNAVDDILSNYFVYRKGGTSSRGAIIIYSTDTHTRVPANYAFLVSDITVTTPITVHGVFPSTEGYESTEYETFVQAVRIGDAYCFSVPVEAQESVSSIIPPGIEVVPLNTIPGFERAELLSPIVGGSEGETDAQFIARARSLVCSWSGGSEAINKILLQSGVPLFGSQSFDTSSTAMSRVSGSTLYIGTGGMIDTYVKTSQYPLRGSVNIPVSDIVDGSVNITSRIPAGVLSVDRVVCSAGPSITYEVIWGSSVSNITPTGARFSVYQTTTLSKITPSPVDGHIMVEYTYMPYITELQDYVSRADVRPVGIDILIKSAIPAVVTIQGSVSSSQQVSSGVVESIKQFVNNKQIGEHHIDVSDLNRHLYENSGAVYLNSPVYMKAVSININGEYTDLVDSVSGLLRLNSNDPILTGVKFLCISDEGVFLE